VPAGAARPQVGISSSQAHLQLECAASLLVASVVVTGRQRADTDSEPESESEDDMPELEDAPELFQAGNEEGGSEEAAAAAAAASSVGEAEQWVEGGQQGGVLAGCWLPGLTPVLDFSCQC
jgi:hypothetical protein